MDRSEHHRTAGRSLDRLLGPILLGTLLHIGALQAQTTYYVSPGGSDGNAGTSTGTPWQTITPVNALLTSQDNVEVLFERGGVYRGTVEVNGRSDILLGAYGSGNDPVISGSVEVTGWTAHSGDIYKADAQLDAGQTISHVYVNGELMTLARWPNTGWLRNDNGSTTTLEDAALTQSNGYWDNASIVVRTANWSYHNVGITDFSGSTLTFAEAVPDLAGYDWGYFLCNSFAELDQPGEWYYDGTDLYLWVPGGGTPSDVEATILYDADQYNQGATAYGSQRITFDGLVFTHRPKAGVSSYGSDDVTVKNCTFSHLHTGIGSDVGTGHVYGQGNDGNLFQQVYDAGIRTSTGNCRIEGNTFLETGLHPGLGVNGWGYMALRSSGDGVEIRGNRFQDIGYSAMEVTGNEGLVEENTIISALRILNDGGGITFDECGTGSQDGLLIRKNIVVGLSENLPEKLASMATNHHRYSDVSYGIYFGDDHIKRTKVQDNVVARCGVGIHVDHTDRTEGNEVHGNTLYDNAVQLSLSDWSNHRNTTPEDVNAPQGIGGQYHIASYDTDYDGNILYSVHEDQLCMQQHNVWAAEWDLDPNSSFSEPLVQFGTFDNNYYFNPYNELTIWIRTEIGRGAGSDPDPDRKLGLIPRTLAHWKAETGQDANSAESPLRSKRFMLLGPDGPDERVSNGDFESGLHQDWDACVDMVLAGSPPGRFGSLGHLESYQCEWIQECNSPSTVGGAQNGPWLFTCKLEADDHGILKVSLPYWDNNPPGTWIPMGTTRREISVLLHVDVTQNEAACPVLHDITWWAEDEGLMPNGQSTRMYMDDVSLQKYNVAYVDPANDHILHYHDPLDPGGYQPLVLRDCWKDVDGNNYNGTVQLAPWESIVLYRATEYEPLALDANGEHHITTNTTWDTGDMNVKGSILIDDGATLTIDGIVVGFADSRDVGITTNIVVKPGGKLELKNGTLLTTVPGCGDNAMWDGIKAPRVENADPDVLPEIDIRYSFIENALTAILFAEADPMAPLTGATLGAWGNLHLEDAELQNNRYGVVFSPLHHAHQDAEYTNQTENRVITTEFNTSDALNYPHLKPAYHAYLRNLRDMEFDDCVFANTSGLDATNPSAWGSGIFSVDANMEVSDCDFVGLDRAVGTSSIAGDQYVVVWGCQMNDCLRGVFLGGTQSTIVNSNIIQLAQVDPFALVAIPATYGLYVDQASGFEIEDNQFYGPGYADLPMAGAIFHSTGSESNRYYNNTFDDIWNIHENSAGTIIMGNNDGNDPGDGLHLKCNDYAQQDYNDFDLACTGENASIGNRQGTADDETEPAGNTFAASCFSEQHLYAEDAIAFDYCHHLLSTAPTHVHLACTSSVATIAHTEAQFTYTKETACPAAQLMLLGGDGLMAQAAEADSELAALRGDYEAWKDGGDTEGLLALVRDPAKDAQAVAEELARLAPSVSDVLWEAVFTRTPALTSAQLAQALTANSPLTPKVQKLAEAQGLDHYHRDQVRNAQQGRSTHQVMTARIGARYQRKALAMHALTARALRNGGTEALDSALLAHQRHPLHSSARSILALQLAQGDLRAARHTVDGELARDRQAGYWKVQDLHLALLEEGMGPEALDGKDRAYLQELAATHEPGAARARAWLRLLGEEWPEEIILPSKREAAFQQREEEEAPATRSAVLEAYPNPSNGPVYLAYEVPEGVAQVRVVIVDAIGRVVADVPLDARKGVMELPTGYLGNGLHFAGLHLDGVRVATAKLNVMR